MEIAVLHFAKKEKEVFEDLYQYILEKYKIDYELPPDWSYSIALPDDKMAERIFKRLKKRNIDVDLNFNFYDEDGKQYFEDEDEYNELCLSESNFRDELEADYRRGSLGSRYN